MSRVPPQNREAERAVLGAMLLSRAVIDDVVDVLGDGRDFYEPRHERIYAAIMARHERGEPVDAILLAEELGPDLERVGGAPYLHDLLAAVPSPASAAFYALQVRETAARRALIESGTRIAQLGWDGTGDSDALYDRAEEVLSSARRVGHADTSTPIDAAVLGALERLEADDEAGITLGQPDLDEIVEPLKPGQLTVVGARPGCGKSVFLLDLARHAVLRLGVPTLLVSLEMRASELATRLIAAEAAVDMRALQRRQLEERHWARVRDAVGRITGAPLWIEDEPALDMSVIRAKVRAHVRRHKVGLVLLDYLQLITAPPAPSRREAVDAVSRGLKVLAGSAGVPLVVAAQLNRAVETRHDRTPTLADLRESGGIEADADNVLLLHRPGGTDQEALESGEVEVTVAKQRAGKLGRARLGFQAHYARMVSLARPEQYLPRNLQPVGR